MITDFGSRCLVETGTGTGADIEYAARFDFDQVYSIEPSHKLAIQVAFRNARNQKITILQSRIERGLKDALEDIPADAPVIFWMDSHPDLRTIAPPSPLERELRLVAGLRDISHDVFLIDDRRVYEDGDFVDGPCPPEQRAPESMRRLDFVEEVLGATHHLTRLTQGTGYLCAFPRR